MMCSLLVITHLLMVGALGASELALSCRFPVEKKCREWENMQEDQDQNLES